VTAPDFSAGVPEDLDRSTGRAPSGRPELVPESVRLDGRRALVTGAGRGIGRATALALARFGADVAVCDRIDVDVARTGYEVAGLGRRTCVGVLDVRDPDAVDAYLAQVAEDLGGLDVVVNNAGGGFFSPVLDVSAGGRHALIAENFTQVLDVTTKCVPLMADGGAVVNITSIEGHRAGPGFGIYSAMKAAVENLTRTLALELADRRIRVNAVAPDMIPTPGDAGLMADSAAVSDTGWALTPWPDEGHPDDVAAAVVFLASDLGRFVTGTTLHVDGGTMAASGWKRPADGGGWVL
jgi:NAD(P)-dependent dehydrogenase (short-subunit alcohol dehydrogenase family)